MQTLQRQLCSRVFALMLVYWYSEKVKVSALKEYILLEGDGARLTKIQWGDHARIDRTQPNDGMIAPDDTMQSATFTVFASNFKARGIEFTVSPSLLKLLLVHSFQFRSQVQNRIN